MVYRKINFLWGLLLWLGVGGLPTVKGQFCDSQKKGGFTMNFDASNNSIVGCAPLTITVQSTVTGAENVAYNFDYKDELAPNTNPAASFTYSKPGKYKILQTGSANAEGFAACREVIVLDNTPPKVTASTCSGGNVKLTFANDSISKQYDQIEIQWYDASPVAYLNKGGSLEIEHKFFGSGTRLIQYRGIYTTNAGSCSGSATNLLRVEVNGNKLDGVIISKVEARADGSVDLTFKGIEGVESEVLVKTGAGAYASVNVKSSKGGTQKITLPGLDSKQVHCLKLRTADACGSFNESNEVCTVVVSGTAGNEQNVLSWTPYPVPTGFRSYQLFRNDNPIQAATTAGNETSYTDTRVECGVSYRYQVVATTDKAISVSAPIEVTAKSAMKPGTISQAIVSVEQDGSVSLVAFPPAQGTTPTYKMIFERADGPNATFKELGVVENTNRYTDATAATSQQSYCYRIQYENACGNRSEPSELICTVFLNKAGTAIRWTGEAPFTDEVDSYFVIKLNPSGASSETGVGPSTTYDPQFDDPNEQEFNYQIRVRSKNGAFLSYSNVILYRREAALFVPDAFSPNGDGVNDIFKPSGNFYDNFQLIVYNRWGQSVFQTTDAATGWDGTIRGDRAPEGQYIFKIIITDSTGKEFVKKGPVLLLR